MSALRNILIVLLLLFCVDGFLYAQKQDPRMGYLYPAGVQRGGAFRIVAGGQGIINADIVEISGKGVRAEVVQSMKPFPPNLDPEERYLIADTLLRVVEARLREAGLSGMEIDACKDKLMNRQPWNALKKKDLVLEGVVMPESPLLLGIEDKTLREVIHVSQMLFPPFKYKQQNRQLAESVIISVTVDKDADLCEREVRLRSSRGWCTNPLHLQLSDYPVKYDLEPNDEASTTLPWELLEMKNILTSETFEVPLIINGQIMPSDVDRFRFKAQKGQKLLIEADARRLMPFLADAVPGWFQAVMAVYDADGHELAFADDHMFSPDPVIFFEVPNDGEYEVEIRDSIYRGREDFVYRISVSENTDAWREMTQGSTYGDRWSRRAVMPPCISESDIIPEEVLSLKSVAEKTANDNISRAQFVELPVLVNGCISGDGDIDVFKISTHGAMKIAVELYGRRLGSPLDSFVKITDKSGKVMAYNDDYVVKDKQLNIEQQGIITHHADSVLLAEIPEAGDYYVHVSDVCGHGGPQYGYRLRISPPMPGFVLMATPSMILSRQGDSMPIKVYAARRDGYHGDIEIKLKTPCEGFSITGGIIPAEVVESVMTLEASVPGTGEPLKVELFGEASIDGNILSAPVLPAERVMQAFLYEHLLPVDEMRCVLAKQKWAAMRMERVGPSLITLKPGAMTTLKYKLSWKKGIEDGFELVVEDAPEGVVLDGQARLTEDGFECDINISPEIKTPLEANIILSVFKEKKAPKEGMPERKDRWRLRYLPAIPVKICMMDDTTIAEQ